MDQKNHIKKKWLVLIAALFVTYASLRNFDYSQLEDSSAKDILPILFLTALIFLLRTSIVSAVFLFVQKAWRKITKKD